jgi:LPXTG-motif cell wall-anchored protein
MWCRVFFSTGGTSAATLIWWMIMLISGIIFYIQWRNSLRKTQLQQSEFKKP